MTDLVDLRSPEANLNRVRFAGRDFFTAVDDLVARAQVLFVTEFNDFVVSGTGQMLIDTVAWAVETMSFAIDRQATESYLATARLRRSVSRLTRQIGYKMHGAVAAADELEVTLTTVYAFPVTIPVGFQFRGPQDLVFEAVEAVTFSMGEGPASPPRTVAVREGITRVQSFTGDGTRNQAYRLSPGDERYVADGTVRVTVGGAPWAEQSFIEFTQNDLFEVDSNHSPPIVRFGDGVAGNVPPAGADIVIEYVATKGRRGRAGTDTITAPVTPLVVAFTPIPLTITNGGTRGGDDPESLESAKAKAPLFFAARGVAVTRLDYVGLSQAYTDALAGSVAVAQAFVAHGAADDLRLQELLQDVRDIVQPLRANVVAETGAARTVLGAIEDSVSDISDAMTTVQASLNVVASNPLTPSLGGAVATIRSEAVAVRSDVTDANVLADEGIADATLLGKDARFVDIQTGLAGISARLDTIVAACGLTENEVAAASTASAAAASSAVAVGAGATVVRGHLGAIDAYVLPQFETVVEDVLADIYDHVDGWLAADCKSNLVQVPILSRDADGFFAPPPVALVRSLQDYLDARKEVTQVIEVVSGEPYLVRASMRVVVGILPGFVQATVLSGIRVVIDNLLRNRPFGRSLRVSDVYTAIVPDPLRGTGGVRGVSYAQIAFTAPAARINADGNIIITQQQVVSRGTITLVPELAAA